ncbi:hypothetical protein F5Y00DRAFT_80110 [Daldinia vernicosa]|uniref:uncharacterized protein n=1 Tax=Daldinia vernicosa TaxID=114800 RepID=UPI002007BFBF|nr:uncharacterized protein F5Y00DRAFT_80110 [Daldinia vernicosa]KAI0848693.1 hypothetical protein F5Y00DRAFT_80110 [Daldinia vernicosa]
MSHLPPSQAIFSPSVARAAASTAKDWSYIDTWLRSIYSNSNSNSNSSRASRPPPFERNPETLKALLALATANEAADEHREQLARVEEAALEEVRSVEREREERRRRIDAQKLKQQQQQQQGGQEIKEAEEALDGDILAADLLSALESSLSKDGAAALDAMASMAVELGVAYPTPEILGSKFAELQGRAFELEDGIERIDLLRRYLDRESARAEAFLAELQQSNANTDSSLNTHNDNDSIIGGSGSGSGSSTSIFTLPPTLPKQNLSLQRLIKSTSSHLPDLTHQVHSLEKSIGLPSLTVDDVRADEEAYLDLLSRKKDLDAQVRAFAGLPPDIDAARAELEALRAELRNATERRDEDFEKLVERESPVKSRRRPRLD